MLSGSIGEEQSTGFNSTRDSRSRALLRFPEELTVVVRAQARVLRFPTTGLWVMLHGRSAFSSNKPAHKQGTWERFRFFLRCFERSLSEVYCRKRRSRFFLKRDMVSTFRCILLCCSSGMYKYYRRRPTDGVQRWHSCSCSTSTVYSYYFGSTKYLAQCCWPASCGSCYCKHSRRCTLGSRWCIRVEMRCRRMDRSFPFYRFRLKTWQLKCTEGSLSGQMVHFKLRSSYKRALSKHDEFLFIRVMTHSINYTGTDVFLRCCFLCYALPILPWRFQVLR